MVHGPSLNVSQMTAFCSGKQECADPEKAHPAKGASRVANPRENREDGIRERRSFLD